MNQKKQELEQNELAGVLEEKLEALKPHAFLISVVVIGVIASIILIAWLVKSSNAIAGSRWEQLFLADHLNDSRQLEQVADDNKNTAAGSLALIKAADIDSIRSLSRAVPDKEEQKALLRSAKENYRKAYETGDKLAPLFKRRALFGLAYTCESLGEFEEAKKHYQTLVDTAEGTPIYEHAVQGLERTNDNSYASLLSEYADWTPPTTAPVGSRRPNIDFSLDGEPDVSDSGSGIDDGLIPPNRENNDEEPEDSSGSENESEDNSDEDQ